MDTAQLCLVGVGAVYALGDVGDELGPVVPPLVTLHPYHFVKGDLCQFHSQFCTSLGLAALGNTLMVGYVIFFQFSSEDRRELRSTVTKNNFWLREG